MCLTFTFENVVRGMYLLPKLDWSNLINLCVLLCCWQPCHSEACCFRMKLLSVLFQTLVRDAANCRADLGESLTILCIWSQGSCLWKGDCQHFVAEHWGFALSTMMDESFYCYDLFRGMYVGLHNLFSSHMLLCCSCHVIIFQWPSSNGSILNCHMNYNRQHFIPGSTTLFKETN